MITIPMPRLSDSMEEGVLVAWLKDNGDSVKRGDELAEIETDKANMTYEADAEGFLHQIAAVDEVVLVGAPIAVLLAEGEEPPSGDVKPAAEGAEEARPEPASQAEAATTVHAPANSSAAPGVNREQISSGSGGRIKASPLARRVATEKGIELQTLEGTGPRGRIVRDDVERAAASQATAVVPSNGGSGEPSSAKGRPEIVTLTRTQTLIARRMSESKATIPDFQVVAEAEVSRLVELRAGIKEQAGSAPSINDFVVKAVALALRDHPRMNGAYKNGAFELYPRINIGVAVAAEDTLVVPTLFDADKAAVSEIGARARDLAGKVRDASISPPELAGGTFTVSNLGMFGVSSFTAVITPGQAAILAVGGITERVVIRDGEAVAAPWLTLSLNSDHRIIYGADAARFLAQVRKLLEAPLGLLA